MASTGRFRKLSVPQWCGRIRHAVIWAMILAVMQILLPPVASHAEMAQPQISDSVGIGLLAGFVAILIAVGLLSRKAETAPASHDQNDVSTISLPQDTAPCPCPAGSVAIASW